VFLLVRGVGSGGIRSTGASGHARFQDVGQPCRSMFQAADCGITCHPSDSAWDTQQPVATWLLHTDAQVVNPAALPRTVHTVARLVVAEGRAIRCSRQIYHLRDNTSSRMPAPGGSWRWSIGTVRRLHGEHSAARAGQQ
jgi:hypothetical protein